MTRQQAGNKFTSQVRYSYSCEYKFIVTLILGTPRVSRLPQWDAFTGDQEQGIKSNKVPTLENVERR